MNDNLTVVVATHSNIDMNQFLPTIHDYFSSIVDTKNIMVFNNDTHSSNTLKYLSDKYSHMNPKYDEFNVCSYFSDHSTTDEYVYTCHYRRFLNHQQLPSPLSLSPNTVYLVQDFDNWKTIDLLCLKVLGHNRFRQDDTLPTYSTQQGETCISIILQIVQTLFSCDTDTLTKIITQPLYTREIHICHNLLNTEYVFMTHNFINMCLQNLPQYYIDYTPRYMGYLIEVFHSLFFNMKVVKNEINVISTNPIYIYHNIYLL